MDLCTVAPDGTACRQYAGWLGGLDETRQRPSRRGQNRFHRKPLMKKFLVLYRAPISAREQMSNASPEQAKAGMDAWMQWAGGAGHAIVDMGAPTQSIAHLSGSTHSGDIGGYGLVQADSADAARALFDAHPHLVMPGASIEILELLSLPGM